MQQTEHWGYGRVNWDQASMWIRQVQKLQESKERERKLGELQTTCSIGKLVMLVVLCIGYHDMRLCFPFSFSRRTGLGTTGLETTMNI